MLASAFAPGHRPTMSACKFLVVADHIPEDRAVFAHRSGLREEMEPVTLVPSDLADGEIADLA